MIQWILLVSPCGAKVFVAFASPCFIFHLLSLSNVLAALVQTVVGTAEGHDSNSTRLVVSYKPLPPENRLRSCGLRIVGSNVAGDSNEECYFWFLAVGSVVERLSGFSP